MLLTSVDFEAARKKPEVSPRTRSNRLMVMPFSSYDSSETAKTGRLLPLAGSAVNLVE